MMPPFVVFPTNRIAHFVEVSLYLFYLAQQVNSVVRTLAKVGKRVRIGSNVTISNEVIVPDDEDIKNGVALY